MVPPLIISVIIMDMDMDVNWCLTCSKRTLDSRNPYCSEACRQADIHVASATKDRTASSNAHPAFANPFASSPQNALISSSSRPPLAPLIPPLIIAPMSEPAPRDRRAFSFPAEQMYDTPTKRRDSMLLPAFARKPKITHHATTTNTTPLLGATRKLSLKVPSGEKLSKSTGANTPLVIDSVFCSTSESSDNEGTGKRNKLRLTATTSTTAKPTAVTRSSRSARPSLPIEFSKSAGASLRAPSYLTSKEYAQRKKSQSPVSPMVGAIASSSSSRSREDIISWVKAVKSRPGDTDTSEDEGRSRGRSRTRKAATPETVRENPEDEHLSTTPKGRMESVFSGLTMGRFGVGPIVKALTSVTGSGNAAPKPSGFKRPETGSATLTSAPAPATVSKVAVVSSTTPGSSGFVIEDNQIYFGGATPTLSTVSLSEANDPTSVATDAFDQDHGDLLMIDDQSTSAASSSQRRPSAPIIRDTTFKPKQTTSTKAYSQVQPLSPMRPVQSTASAIWNLSTYLRSFAPFSLPQPSPASSKETSPSKDTPSTEMSDPTTSVAAASPMPASRIASRAPSPGKELVRSLPMDIIAPIGSSLVHDDRTRHREAQEFIDSMNRRSRSRRASPTRQSRTRVRSPSPRPLETAAASTAHARQWSYDADQSGTEDDPIEELDDRRGRSHQAKTLNADDQSAVPVEHFNKHQPAERSWSRSREADSRASRSRGRRESPRGRGRDRTIRPV